MQLFTDYTTSNCFCTSALPIQKVHFSANYEGKKFKVRQTQMKTRNPPLIQKPNPFTETPPPHVRFETRQGQPPA